MGLNYRRTRRACFTGYITQAIVNNFPPLLFVLFRESFGIALDRIGLLVTVNFAVQLLVDLVSTRFVDRVGYKRCVIAAHLLCGAGLILFGVLPVWMTHKFAALLTATLFYAVGGGLLEVVISPIVEACPSDNKSGQMSLLHSFYCWGQAGVVVISTLVFTWFGIGSWPVLACLWALLPLGNALVFLASPVPQLHPEGGALGVSALLRTPVFWVLALMMVCGGASEQAMSQWASAFAETGLGVSKTMGDLLGPCLFALMMGLSRVGYAAVSQHRSGALETIMAVCAGTCALGYLIASLCAGAAAPLLGCALVGFSVGLFWPGTFSVASARCPAGGTAMFALLALAGDLGCSGGPYLVGLVSAVNGDRLSAGLLAAVVLPVLLLAAILLCIAMGRKRKNTL